MKKWWSKRRAIVSWVPDKSQGQAYSSKKISTRRKAHYPQMEELLVDHILDVRVAMYTIANYLNLRDF